MKNVLLLCLSKMNSGATERKYQYQINDDDNFSGIVTGYLTNEAPAKSVISRLHHSDKQRLDRIVVVCSETTKKPILVDKKKKKRLSEILLKKNINNEDAPVKKRICELDGSVSEMTHLQYYEAAVKEYAEDTDVLYKEAPIEFCVVDVADDIQTDDISKSAVAAANKIGELGEDVNLYIDFNGGQRYIAFMLLSVANMMKVRGINIEQIMTMNYNPAAKMTRIDNYKPVFNTMNLITGIKEYINYGRIKSLKEYFKDSGNQEIDDVLKAMEEFSNNLQLCRTGYIMDQKKTLYEKLENAKQNFSKKGQKNIYEILFEYVLNDILDGYRDLLEGELPEMLKWCVDRDYIQQALTFCSEQLPKYFWDKGIFRATPEEENEYNFFLAGLKKGIDAARKEKDAAYKTYNANKNEENKKAWKRKKKIYDNYNDLNKGFNSSIKNGDVNKKRNGYEYNWIIKYLQYSCTGTDKELYKNIMSQSSEFNLYSQGPSDEDLKNMLNNIKAAFSGGCIKLGGYSLNSPNSDSHPAVKLMWQFNNKNRVYSNTDMKTLSEVLMVYFMLKDQRNKTNHADDSNNNNTWNYQKIHNVIAGYAELLSGLNKNSVNPEPELIK